MGGGGRDKRRRGRGRRWRDPRGRGARPTISRHRAAMQFGMAITAACHRHLSCLPPIPLFPCPLSLVPNVHLCSRRQPSCFRRRLEADVYASVKLASRQEYDPFRSIPCSEPVENTFGWFVAGMSTLTSTRVLNMDRRYLTVD